MVAFMFLALLGICAIAAVVMVVGYVVNSIAAWRYYHRRTRSEFPWWES